MFPNRTRRGLPVPILLALLLFALLLSEGWAGQQKKHKKQKGQAPPTGDLTVEHKMRYPTRVALGSDGKIYVTDAHRGSVFILDKDRKVTGELKGLSRPLGVAVDASGNIYVGNDGRDNVEVYNAKGGKIATISGIAMPNDLALDEGGNLYAVDSRSDCVWVYDSSQDYVRTIGKSTETFAGLQFPSAVCVAYRPDPDVAGATYPELFVADQGTSRILVFDLEGEFLREFGGPIEESYWGAPRWKGLFARIQGLAFDGDDRLHALDCYMGNVQILDPDTGDYSDSYFTGDDAGTLKIPLDLVITSTGSALVTNAERGRLEVFDSVP